MAKKSAVMLNGNIFKPELLIVSVLLMLIPLIEPVKQKKAPPKKTAKDKKNALPRRRIKTRKTKEFKPEDARAEKGQENIGEI